MQLQQDRSYLWSTRPDPQPRQYLTLFSLEICFVLKIGHGRTDNMCENNDCGLAEWINLLPVKKKCFSNKYFFFLLKLKFFSPITICNLECHFSQENLKAISSNVIVQYPGPEFNIGHRTDFSYWSTRPTTVPAGSDHYFHAECPSVHPKTSKSRHNHCRPRLWAGRVDHWWLLSFSYMSIFYDV